MGLLDGFEKLINEHGSAAILKERIALANDKYAMLEQKLSKSEATKKDLASENEALRLDLERAKVEIQDLKRIAEQAHGSRLDAIKEKILVLLMQQNETRGPTIVQSLGVSEQLAKFHLVDLEKAKLISITTVLSMMGNSPPTTYALTQEGRRYLVTHGLLA